MLTKKATDEIANAILRLILALCDVDTINRKGSPMNSEIATRFIEVSKNRANTARDRIDHCLDQLQDDDLWWIPGEGCNCIGVIIQHLLGNLRQWIISGVGGEEDIRRRPREFVIEERTPKSVLQSRLNGMICRVIETYSRLDASELLEMRKIQGLDVSVMRAIYGTMTHLELHAGQICYITRMRLGGSYKEWWTPANEEQGA